MSGWQITCVVSLVIFTALSVVAMVAWYPAFRAMDEFSRWRQADIERRWRMRLSEIERRKRVRAQEEEAVR